MPNEAVYLHSADIYHRWKIIHAIACAEAIDVEIYCVDFSLAFIPDARHSSLFCDVQDFEVLRKLDCLKIVDVEFLFENCSHTLSPFRILM